MNSKFRYDISKIALTVGTTENILLYYIAYNEWKDDIQNIPYMNYVDQMNRNDKNSHAWKAMLKLNDKRYSAMQNMTEYEYEKLLSMGESIVCKLAIYNRWKIIQQNRIKVID